MKKLVLCPLRRDAVVNLGTQYYRPQFPDPQYRTEDMARIAEAGLNTVQLWAKWPWVKPAPGEFRFDDYDRPEL